MNYLVSTNVQSMTLKEIADLLGVRHDNAMRLMGNLLLDPAFGFAPQFEERDFRGKKYPTYQLDKRQSIAVASRLNIAFLMRIIDRWTELESKQTAPAIDLSNPAHLLPLLQQYAEKTQLLEAKVAEQAPAVEFVEKYVELDGVISFTEVAKLTGMKQPAFRAWLVKHRYLYAGTSGGWLAHAAHLNAGRFQHKTFHDIHGKPHVNAYFTAKGVQYITSKLKAEEVV